MTLFFKKNYRLVLKDIELFCLYLLYYATDLSSYKMAEILATESSNVRHNLNLLRNKKLIFLPHKDQEYKSNKPKFYYPLPVCDFQSIVLEIKERGELEQLNKIDSKLEQLYQSEIAIASKKLYEGWSTLHKSSIKLMEIIHNQQGLTNAELSEALDVSNENCNYHTLTLKKKGWIQRVKNPDDTGSGYLHYPALLLTRKTMKLILKIDAYEERKSEEKDYLPPDKRTLKEKIEGLNESQKESLSFFSLCNTTKTTTNQVKEFFRRSTYSTNSHFERLRELSILGREKNPRSRSGLEYIYFLRPEISIQEIRDALNTDVSEQSTEDIVMLDPEEKDTLISVEKLTEVTKLKTEVIKLKTELKKLQDKSSVLEKEMISKGGRDAEKLIAIITRGSISENLGSF